MNDSPRQRRAWVKTIDGDGPYTKFVIEPTHLMRVDGIEQLTTVKVGWGPVAGYLEAVARALSSALSKKPGDLGPEDLERPELTIFEVDREMRRISEMVGRRSASRRPDDDLARRRFNAALRQRVAARLLARLKPEFVVAANQRILSEARRHDAYLWL